MSTSKTESLIFCGVALLTTALGFLLYQMYQVDLAHNRLIHARADAIAAKAEADSAERGLIFLCGFRSGQLAITSRMPNLFTDPRDTGDGNLSDHCKRLRDVAVKRGLQP